MNPSKLSSVLQQFQLIFSAMTESPRSVATCLFVLAVGLASVAFADDFKTINGKEYKHVTVSRVEPDGIVLRTKFGISKVYFDELPKEVQQRFRQNAVHSQSPSEQVFLTDRVPVKTPSGSVAFAPGTALHVLSKNSDTSQVTDGALTFDVPNDKLTTDANRAARLAQNDYAASEAIAQESARQNEAYQQAEAAKRVERDRRIAADQQTLQRQEAEEARQRQAAAERAAKQWQTTTGSPWTLLPRLWKPQLSTRRLGCEEQKHLALACTGPR